ncbi:Sensory histidine kinase [Chitinispirillum alkaliphilum]|nr:Sensory histidine kinase [Chitinispirillum alkaliphilum]
MSSSKTDSLTRRDYKNVVKGMVLPVMKFLDDKYGSDVTEKILSDIQLDRLYFEDPNGYMPIETTDQLFESAKKFTEDQDFPYTMGRNVFKYMHPLQLKFIACSSTPHLTFKNLCKLEQKVVKTTHIETTRLGSDRFRVKVSFKDNYQEPYSACRNRLGTYEALPTIFELPHAIVEHPKCVFKGDEKCEYIVNIPQYSYQWYLKGSLSVLGTGIMSGIGWLFTGATTPAFIAAVSPVLSMMLYTIFIQKRFKECIKWIRGAERSIEEQSNQLIKDNMYTRNLHELTVQLNREIYCEPISKHITGTLVEKFNYDASQIWIIKGDRFVCSALSGYDENVRDDVLKTEYYISEGLKYSDGFIVRVLKNKETLLINDFEKATVNFTDQSKKMFATLDVSSAIIIPLTDNGIVFGMLVGINKFGKKVSYTDKLFFTTITHIISNSLHKARLYEDMETKIAKRDREIRRRQEQIVLARDMAAQNEKHSSIGQMAAGIAHEINNPLNFLFNIVKDLRNDFFALKKIASITKDNLPSEYVEELESILNQFQLDIHLEEVDEVFKYIDEALEKARKTANSLKVFARTTGNDICVSEKLVSLAEKAIALIPVKYLSAIDISLNIPPDLFVTVNRIEFQQVIFNLLSNAIEATRGEGKIEISARNCGSRVEVIVRDYGKGVDSKYVSSLFEPLFTTKNPQQHTGLGLTVVKELIKKCGGDIEYLSEEQNGTAFKITLRNRNGMVK